MSEASPASVLQGLGAVPGVIGALLCDARGAILADGLPPAFDRSRLAQVAAVLVGRTAALEASHGESSTLDLRFSGVRVVVRTGGPHRLVFLCHPAANLSLLGLTAADLFRRLEVAGPPPTATPAAPAGALYRTLQRIDAHLEQAGAQRFKLRGRIAVRAGLALELVGPDTPDDPAALERLRAAASEVLGRTFV